MRYYLPTDWPPWARVVLAILIAVVVATCLLLFFPGASPQAEQVSPSPWDARMTALDKEPLDAAYRTQLAHLFAVWMKSPEGQPGRAIVGANQARRAYTAVMIEIEKREQAQAPGR